MVISVLVKVQYILSQTGVQACLHLHLVVFTCIIHQKCCKTKWKSIPVSLILICLVLCTKVGWRYMYLKARQEAREPILLTWVTYLSLFFICISVCFFFNICNLCGQILDILKCRWILKYIWGSFISLSNFFPINNIQINNTKIELV